MGNSASEPQQSQSHNANEAHKHNHNHNHNHDHKAPSEASRPNMEKSQLSEPQNANPAYE